MQPGGVPVDVVATAVALHELPLGDPVQFAGQAHRVVLEPVEGVLPAAEDVLGLVVGVRAVAFLDVLAGQLVVLHLELYGGECAAAAQRDEVLERGVVRDLVEGAYGLVDGEVDGDEAVLDHGEDQGRRAQLEVGRDLRQVRVADDHVQAAPFLGVGVRFVAGVDDGALECRLQADLYLEVVGALAELEAVFVAVLADATRPAPVKTWRETKKGVRWRTMSEKAVSRFIR